MTHDTIIKYHHRGYTLSGGSKVPAYVEYARVGEQITDFSTMYHHPNVLARDLAQGYTYWRVVGSDSRFLIKIRDEYFTGYSESDVNRHRTHVR